MLFSKSGVNKKRKETKRNHTYESTFYTCCDVFVLLDFCYIVEFFFSTLIIVIIIRNYNVYNILYITHKEA